MAVSAITSTVKTIIYLIIFIVVIVIFFTFYNRIVCYFTPKEPFGKTVNDPCSCTSGAYGTWNDKSSNTSTMCCRTPNWKNDFGKGWCIDMEIGDSCMNDWQCSSALCYPGLTGDSKCMAKKKVGEEMEFDRAWSGCESGASGLWNNQKSIKNKALCCPTKDWYNNFSNSWCINLPTDAACIFDHQCKPGFCSPGNTPDSVCKPSATVGEAMDFFKAGAACTTKASGFWNRNDNDPLKAVARCCPTKDWRDGGPGNHNGYCLNLVDTSGCTYNWQCKNGNCTPEETPESVCKPKATKGAEIDFFKAGDACVSKASGLWNDKVSNKARCCPTQHWKDGGPGNHRGYCTELSILDECTYNWQCKTNTCSREPDQGDETMFCRQYTDFSRACSEHDQCKSKWCHAGKCK